MVVALIEELLTKVQQLQLIMIAVSIGKLKIHEKEKEYTLLYKNIADLMESSRCSYYPSSTRKASDNFRLWTNYASRRRLH